MPDEKRTPAFEQRLDQLREEARAKGVVAGNGVAAAGGPIPPSSRTAERAPQGNYYGLPFLKPPVWKWMIPFYFFVGGLAGMAALIAAAAVMKHDWALVRAAIWTAGVGAIISPILLVWDLGRPLLFLHMLRVFKVQSPMSLGSWVLSAFGAAVVPGVILVEWQLRAPNPVVHVLAVLAICGGALAGIFLATYTGALLAVTAVPAWYLHRGTLPFHFGMAGLGSAAGVLELCGFHLPALNLIGYIAAGAETLVLLWLETHKHGAADQALHEGSSGWTLRLGEACEGPLALILRACGLAPIAGVVFALGALLTRFGWTNAGRHSACNPASLLAAQSARTS